MAKVKASAAEEAEDKPKRSKKPQNHSWAQLLKRIFEVDIPICPGCGLGEWFSLEIQASNTFEVILRLRLGSQERRRTSQAEFQQALAAYMLPMVLLEFDLNP